MQDILFIEGMKGDTFMYNRRWCAGTCMIELGNYLSSDDEAGWTDTEDFTGVIAEYWLDGVKNWAESMGYVVVFIPIDCEENLVHRQFAKGVLGRLGDLGIDSKGWFSSWGNDLEK